MIDNSAYSYLNNKVRYIQTFLYIKDELGYIRPLYLNSGQVYYMKLKNYYRKLGKKRRYLVAKSRKFGISTIEQAESFHLTATMANQECATIAHNRNSTLNMFRIAHLFYDRLDPVIRPQRDYENKNELEYPNINSLFYIGTAGSKAFGRGRTLQRAHLSEVAYFPGKEEAIENFIIGILEACRFGEIVAESTGNGTSGWFYNTWNEAKKGGNGWIPIFLPWYVDQNNMLPLDDGEELKYDENEKDLVHYAKETYGIDIIPEQIKWRRDKKRDLKKLFPQEYPENDMEMFISSGLHWFDIEIVRALASKCKPPVEVREDGALLIWKKPEKGHVYVMGGDVGEGLEKSDFSCACVLDARTCEQVACLCGRWRPEVFGEKAAKLGFEYNTAMIAPEANNHGHSTLNTLFNTVHYPNLYKHVDYDADGEGKLGWHTNAKTRPLMLNGIKAALIENLIKVNDMEFLSQCQTFQQLSDGGYGAKGGSFDDLVIAWAIAWNVREQALRNMPSIRVITTRESEGN